jgi:hypothetical protein
MSRSPPGTSDRSICTASIARELRPGPADGKGPLPSRILVINIPAMGDRTVTLDVSLPPGTGVVAAHALQASEHAPHDTFSSDPRRRTPARFAS